MPAPNNPRVARVAMLFQRDTRTFVNTFHVVKPTAMTAADLINIAGIFSSWWNASYRGYSSNAVALKQIQVRKYDPADPLAYDLDVSPPSAGSQVANPDTGATTQTASWRTGLAGRKYRGRFYAVGLPEVATNSDDSVISTETAQLSNAALSLIASVIAASFQLAVFHKSDNTFTQIATVIVENLIDSQRRRLANRGA